MDPSTPSAQDDAQNQKISDQGMTRVQPPVTSAQTPPSQKTSVTISVGKEGSSTVIAAENPNADEDDEDELVAPQETKNQVMAQQGGASVQEEEIVDVKPSTPEVSASPEVEKIIDKTSPEEPEINQELKEAGVTHSGPGIIPGSIAISQNNFGIKKMPEPYEQAVLEEKKTELHDSKHWFSAMIMYIWRKINPELGKKKEIAKDAVPTAVEQIQSEPEVESETALPENEKELINA